MRHFSQTNFLDLLEEDAESGHIRIKQMRDYRVKKLLREYQSVKSRLLEIPFTTLPDYLWLLRTACELLNPLGSRAMLYLAAAVSDFYIPYADQSKHKMQSSEGAPEVKLHLVPKMLKPVVKVWVPDAYVVSFKLETNADLLIPKAAGAIKTYGHKLVIANLLHTRKTRVDLVESRLNIHPIKLSQRDIKCEKEIEEEIVKEVAKRHNKYVKDKQDEEDNC